MYFNLFSFLVILSVLTYRTTGNIQLIDTHFQNQYAPVHTESGMKFTNGNSRRLQINSPTSQPSCQPSTIPSIHPSTQPSLQPSDLPSAQPSISPTKQPSEQPSTQPTVEPSGQPSMQPSSQPSCLPSAQPSIQPSEQPSTRPSGQPSCIPTSQPSTLPTRQPTNQPSGQPTRRPTCQPSIQPSRQPSGQPTDYPSVQPTIQPTIQPSAQPSGFPSGQPSSQPTGEPSAQPSNQPSMIPTSQPSRQPTGQPSYMPSRQPSGQPSQQPSNRPTIQPTSQPTVQPTKMPTMQPSGQPSSQPSVKPSSQPSRQPSRQPTSDPSGQPSALPSSQPSSQPTAIPSSQPSKSPTKQPSGQPTVVPTCQPSFQPSIQPSRQPTGQPSRRPTSQPSRQPSRSPTNQPSAQPSRAPSMQPSCIPSVQPTNAPSMQPSGQPSNQPSDQPSQQPSLQPSSQPSKYPSNQPSAQPSRQPTMQPSGQPSRQPSMQPTVQPSSQPSSQPSKCPTCQPTAVPSSQPTVQPTNQPTEQPTSDPSSQPTVQPSMRPSMQPSIQPSQQPTVAPSRQPSGQPSKVPSSQPSSLPSTQPSRQPSRQPSSQPSCQPTCQPSNRPTMQPTSVPSTQPTIQPSLQPSQQPTADPSAQPTCQPSFQPSTQPSCQPSVCPSIQPTSFPSSQPSRQPSSQPSRIPSTQPSQQPTRQPTGQPSRQPTFQPSSLPSCQPSMLPSAQPSVQPTCLPSVQPTGQPSWQPTSQPSADPSSQPSKWPSSQPSVQPSMMPSVQPTRQPSGQPSMQPSIQPSSQPSRQPTGQPSRTPSVQPSCQPTCQPSGQPTSQPSNQPTQQPTQQPSVVPSSQPSEQPSSQPSFQPSVQPSGLPTKQPSGQPSKAPSVQPSSQPSQQPSARPSRQPSVQPSSRPSLQPSSQPSKFPTSQPSMIPSVQPSTQPSLQPTSQPTGEPSSQPSTQPSTQPTSQPTQQPSGDPTSQPSSQPSELPSCQPSQQPSRQPSGQPSKQPSVQPSSQPSLCPSVQPSAQPSRQPSSRPSIQPSNQPTRQPSRQPTSRPSMQPSVQPSRQPSTGPTCQPSRQPSRQPTGQPSQQPSCQPTFRPSMQPTGQPSRQPSVQPSRQPSVQPSVQPSLQPSVQPTCRPSQQPSIFPSSQPSNQPTITPSLQPSSQPSVQPSASPSAQPSERPSSQPSIQPSAIPTMQPSTRPTAQPSRNPSSQPSRQPSQQPTSVPSVQPSSQPSIQPSRQPSGQPSRQPTMQPSIQPTTQPTGQPSRQPSQQPSVQPSVRPSKQPTAQPSSVPTVQPSIRPSSQPSVQPTSQPTNIPSCQPSIQPSSQPTSQPSINPTSQPSSQPSGMPSSQPTLQPSTQPSAQPSHQPSVQPTIQPSIQPSQQPSSQPSRQPSVQPSSQPSIQPSSQPSSQPSITPSCQPSIQPSAQPSIQPSSNPSRQPSCQPSKQPTSLPSSQPSSCPTIQPSMHPSTQPSKQPTCQPSVQPSIQPTMQPSRQPSIQPSAQPSRQPSIQPSSQPSSQPTSQPSRQPSIQPSMQPSGQPSRQPSVQPSSQPSSQPSRQPSLQPSTQPTGQPSQQPSRQPSTQPTRQPSSQPSSQPSVQPSMQPSVQPTNVPSSHPSGQPSIIPSEQPSSQPSRQPSIQPTKQPSIQPSVQPTSQPTMEPSGQPSVQPSSQPSSQPTIDPTSQPSSQPSGLPSVQPSVQPTMIPSCQPSMLPTNQPTGQPSMQPSIQPTVRPSRQPSSQPSRRPSMQPTGQPSRQPSIQPTARPTVQPSAQPSRQPSVQPTRQPTGQPSRQPSSQPSTQPIGQPTTQPSRQPSGQPSRQPSRQPSSQPSRQPSRQPSGQPSRQPSSQPTRQPVMRPSSQPSQQPTRRPTGQPTQMPSTQPTLQPFSVPTGLPSSQPSNQPTNIPLVPPSSIPSMQPSIQPTGSPTRQPTSQPSRQPSRQPTGQPTGQPSGQPSRQPSRQPTGQPSGQPSRRPTCQPTRQPFARPSGQPSIIPSGQPSFQPWSQPSAMPTIEPSSQPTFGPTSDPTSVPSRQPSIQPTANPTQPTSQPSSKPTHYPTYQPSSSPSCQPSSEPTSPTSQPTAQPTLRPSPVPTPIPTSQNSPRVTIDAYITIGNVTAGRLDKEAQKALREATGEMLSFTASHVFYLDSVPVSKDVNQSRWTTIAHTQFVFFMSEVPWYGNETLNAYYGLTTILRNSVASHSFTDRMRNRSIENYAVNFTYSDIQNVTFFMRKTVLPPTPYPTILPTPAPTFSVTSLWMAQVTVSQAAIVEKMNNVSSAYNRKISMYTELDVAYGGSNNLATPLYGSCNTWASSLYGEFSLHQVTHKMTDLTLTVVKSTTSRATSFITESVTCSEVSKAERIMSFLSRRTSSILQTTTGEGTVCSGRTWLIKTCAGQSEHAVPAVCVDCTDPCDSTNHCLRKGTNVMVAPLSITSCSVQNCTGTSIERQSSAIRVFSVIFEEREIAPRIVSAQMTADRTSITITASLSASATLYCGVFPNGTVTIATNLLSNIALQGFKSTLSSGSNNVSRVEMRGLVPGTGYGIYCYTVTPTGVAMSLTEVMKQVYYKSTLCCKTLTATLSSLYVPQNTAANDILMLKFSSKPTVDMVVTLFLTYRKQIFHNDSSEVTTVVNGESVTRTVYNAYHTTEMISMTNVFLPTLMKINALEYFANSPADISTGLISDGPVTLHSSLPPLSEVGEYSVYLTVFSAALNGRGDRLTREYDVIFSNNNTVNGTISVLKTGGIVPSPVLLHATFSNDGSYIAIVFDSKTNRGGTSSSFTCSMLFNFVCSSTSRCLWISDTIVHAYVTGDNCAVSGDLLSFASGAVITAKCLDVGCIQTTWPRSVILNSRIQSPANAVVPVVTLSMPSTIGSCDSLSLDVSGSSGSGGREWKNSTFAVTSTVNVAILQAFLNANASTELSTTIPRTMFTSGASYVFRVTLCNFLGKCGQVNKQLLVLSSVVPSVTLPGLALRTITPNLGLSIHSLAFVSGCSGNTSNLGLSYTWSVYEGSTLLVNVVSVSKDPSKLLLLPHTLTAYKSYTVRLTVTILATLKSSSASVDMYVRRGAVVARVTGGSVRSVRLNETAQIDASSSYDEEVGGESGLKAGLIYSWSCSQLLPISMDSCENAIEVGSLQYSNDLYAINQIYTIIPLWNAVLGTTIEITTTVTDASGMRSSSVLTRVILLPSLSPAIRLNTNLNGVGSINPDKVLKISAIVQMPVGTRGDFVWSVDDSSLDLSTKALTPLRTTAIASTYSSSALVSVYFVLAPNSLIAGSSLTFTLSCTTQFAGRSAVASVVVNVNSPPSPGRFFVTPASGTAATEKFKYVANQWQDVDMPLTYQFGYISDVNSNVVMRSKQEFAHGTSQLPAGLESMGNVVTCFAQIFDSYSANTTVTVGVTVRTKAYVTTTLDSFVTESLAMGSGSVDEIKQSVALVSAVLNQVNCSAAPNCAALFRKGCRNTVNTCGSCEPAYVGEQGDSNVACVLRSTMQETLSLMHNSTLFGSCDSSLECDPFQICDRNSSRCILPLQQCPNDCHGRGTCIFVNADSGVPVSECRVTHTNCSAVCLCPESHSLSSSCGFANAEIETRRAYRDQMVSKVAELVQSEDAGDVAVVAGWMNALSVAIQQSDEISLTTVDKVLSTTNIVIGHAADTDMSYVGAASVLGAVNSASKAANNARRNQQRRLFGNTFPLDKTSIRRKLLMVDGTTVESGVAMNVSSTVSAVIATLKQYGSMVTAGMSPGQHPVESIFDQFRISSSVVSAAHANGSAFAADSTTYGNATIFVPLTSFELVRAVNKASVLVPLNTNDSGTLEDIEVSLISIRSQLFDVESAFVANPLTLSLSREPCLSNDTSSDECNVFVTLQNTVSQFELYQLYESDDFNVTCKPDYKPVTYYYTCPNEVVLNLTCNGTMEGLLFTKCPYVTHEPICNNILPSGGVNSSAMVTAYSGCRVISYSPTSTTCSCPLTYVNESAIETLNYNATSRRLLTTSSGGAVSTNFVGMLKRTTESYNELYQRITTDPVPMKGFRVIATFSSVAIAWLFVILFGVDRDEKDRAAKEEYERQHRLADKPLLSAMPAKKRQSVRNAESSDDSMLSKVQVIARRIFSFRNVKVQPVENRHAKNMQHMKEQKAHSKATNADVQHLEDSLPKVLQTLPLATKLYNECCQHHRWISIFAHYSFEVSRAMRMLSLFSYVLAVLFVDAVIYYYINRDDGTCTYLKTQSACAEPKTKFLTQTDMCSWNPRDGGVSNTGFHRNGYCEFIQADTDMVILLAVAIVSAIVGVAISSITVYIIRYILCVPTTRVVVDMEDDFTSPVARKYAVTKPLPSPVKSRYSHGDHDFDVVVDNYNPDLDPDLEDQAEQVEHDRDLDARVQLRISTQNKKLLAKQKQYHDAILEFAELAKHIRVYRETELSANLLANAEAASPTDKMRLDEFDFVWGLNKDGNFKTLGVDGEPTVPVPRGIVYRALHRIAKRCGISGIDPQDVKMRVLADIIAAKKAELSELAAIKIQQDKLMMNGVDEKMLLSLHSSIAVQINTEPPADLGKRLLFLYALDLVNGLTALILRNKAMRDFPNYSTVSKRSKLIWGTFAVLLNFAMFLFVIYVFALQVNEYVQNAWLMSFLVWLVIEWFLASGFAVCLTHVVIPTVIMSEMTRVKQKILEGIKQYQKELLIYQQAIDDEEEEKRRAREEEIKFSDESNSEIVSMTRSSNQTRRPVRRHSMSFYSKASVRSDDEEREENEQLDAQFNVGKYLFVSTRLARHYPRVMESKLIRHFVTPYPRVCYTQIVPTNRNGLKEHTTVLNVLGRLRRQIAIATTFLLTVLLNCPIMLQDVVTDVLFFVAIGIVIFLHIQLWYLQPGLAFIPVFFFGFLIHFIVQSSAGDAIKRVAELNRATDDITEFGGVDDDEEDSISEQEDSNLQNNLDINLEKQDVTEEVSEGKEITGRSVPPIDTEQNRDDETHDIANRPDHESISFFDSENTRLTAARLSHAKRTAANAGQSTKLGGFPGLFGQDSDEDEEAFDDDEEEHRNNLHPFNVTVNYSHSDDDTERSDQVQPFFAFDRNSGGDNVNAFGDVSFHEYNAVHPLTMTPTADKSQRPGTESDDSFTFADVYADKGPPFKSSSSGTERRPMKSHKSTNIAPDSAHTIGSFQSASTTKGVNKTPGRPSPGNNSYIRRFSNTDKPLRCESPSNNLIITNHSSPDAHETASENQHTIGGVNMNTTSQLAAFSPAALATPIAHTGHLYIDDDDEVAALPATDKPEKAQISQENAQPIQTMNRKK